MKIYPFVYSLFTLSFIVGCATNKNRVEWVNDKTRITIESPSESKAPAKVNITDAGALSFTAPLSFSPSEKESAKADGDAVRIEAKSNARANVLWNVAGILAVIVGAFMLWRGHVKAGWICIIAAPAFVMLAEFGKNKTALAVAMGGCGLALGIFIAWYFVRGKIANTQKV